MVHKLRTFLSFVQFEHTLFGLPFAIIGFGAGVRDIGAFPHERIVIFTFLCFILARNAAMSFNRIIDRDIDAKNQRTRDRELPSGKIQLEHAIAFCVVNSILFIIATYFINNTVFFLSPLALIVLFFYSLSKRFTWFSHFILGLALSMSPAGAYLAVTETLSPEIMLLSFIVILWVSGFDIIYATQDIEFDRLHRLYSIPAQFGMKRSKTFALFLHLITAFLLILWWFVFYMYSISVLLGIIIFQIFMFYQHLHLYLSNTSNDSRTFVISNGTGSLIFSLFYILQFM